MKETWWQAACGGMAYTTARRVCKYVVVRYLPSQARAEASDN